MSEPALVAPFEYAAMPVAVALGVLLFGDWPTPLTWLGIALVVGSGLYVLHREVLAGRRAGGSPARSSFPGAAATRPTRPSRPGESGPTR